MIELLKVENMKWLCFVFVTTFLLGLTEVWGEDWKLFHEYKHDWSSKFYYNTESIVIMRDGYIRLWVLIKNERLTKDLPEHIPSSIKNLLEINCSVREYRNLQIEKFYKNGRHEEEGAQEKWEYMSPKSSPDEALYNLICGKGGK